MDEKKFKITDVDKYIKYFKNIRANIFKYKKNKFAVKYLVSEDYDPMEDGYHIHYDNCKTLYWKIFIFNNFLTEDDCPKIVNCYGEKCRIMNGSEYCESCFEDLDYDIDEFFVLRYNTFDEISEDIYSFTVKYTFAGSDDIVTYAY